MKNIPAGRRQAISVTGRTSFPASLAAVLRRALRAVLGEKAPAYAVRPAGSGSRRRGT